MGKLFEQIRSAVANDRFFVAWHADERCMCWSSSSSHANKIMRTEEPPMHRRKLPPIHPGEILMEEFLSPLGISQYRQSWPMIKISGNLLTHQPRAHSLEE